MNAPIRRITVLAAASGTNTGLIDLGWTAPADRETNLSASTLKGGTFLIFRSTRASDAACAMAPWPVSRQTFFEH